MFFEKIAPYTYRIPRQGKMRVDAVFFASKEILKDLEAENYASLQQLIGRERVSTGAPLRTTVACKWGSPPGSLPFIVADRVSDLPK